MDDKVSLGNILKDLRQSKGFTQEYVAEKLNFASRYVSDLERDKSLGGIPTLIKLCNLYEVTPTYILQNYLNLNEDLHIDPNLVGFYSLDEQDKTVVIKLIEFLNNKKTIV